MPREPLRLDRALGHLPGQHDLERPLTQPQVRNSLGVGLEPGCLLLGQQAVEAVDMPVEFFLQRDHPAPDVVMFAAGDVQSVSGGDGHGADG